MTLSDDFITESAFTLGQNEQTAEIVYNRLGKSYKLIVPFSRSLSSTMNKCRLYLVSENKEIDITQQPGIPYLVSASQLGGTKIIARFRSGDEKTFFADEIPKI